MDLSCHADLGSKGLRRWIQSDGKGCANYLQQHPSQQSLHLQVGIAPKWSMMHQGVGCKCKESWSFYISPPMWQKNICLTRALLFMKSSPESKKPPMFQSLSDRTLSRKASSGQKIDDAIREWTLRWAFWVPKFKNFAPLWSLTRDHPGSYLLPVSQEMTVKAWSVEFQNLSEQHLGLVAEALISGHLNPWPWSHLSFAKHMITRMGSDAALLVPNSMFPKVINNFLMQKN